MLCCRIWQRPCPSTIWCSKLLLGTSQGRRGGQPQTRLRMMERRLRMSQSTILCFSFHAFTMKAQMLQTRSRQRTGRSYTTRMAWRICYQHRTATRHRSKAHMRGMAHMLSTSHSHKAQKQGTHAWHGAYAVIITQPQGTNACLGA